MGYSCEVEKCVSSEWFNCIKVGVCCILRVSSNSPSVCVFEYVHAHIIALHISVRVWQCNGQQMVPARSADSRGCHSPHRSPSHRNTDTGSAVVLCVLICDDGLLYIGLKYHRDLSMPVPRNETAIICDTIERQVWYSEH